MPPTASETVRRRLDRAFNGILLLIAVQFFLGMWINLFAPPTVAGTFSAASSDVSDPALVAHIGVGVVLGIAAIATVVLSLRDPYRPIRLFAVGGLVGIIFAGLTGSGFVYSGYSSATDSFLMAVGFAVALTSYYEGLVRMGKASLSGTITGPSGANPG